MTCCRRAAGIRGVFAAGRAAVWPGCRAGGSGGPMSVGRRRRDQAPPSSSNWRGCAGTRRNSSPPTGFATGAAGQPAVAGLGHLAHQNIGRDPSPPSPELTTRSPGDTFPAAR